ERTSGDRLAVWPVGEVGGRDPSQAQAQSGDRVGSARVGIAVIPPIRKRQLVSCDEQIRIPPEQFYSPACLTFGKRESSPLSIPRNCGTTQLRHRPHPTVVEKNLLSESCCSGCKALIGMDLTGAYAICINPPLSR